MALRPEFPMGTLAEQDAYNAYANQLDDVTMDIAAHVFMVSRPPSHDHRRASHIQVDMRVLVPVHDPRGPELARRIGEMLRDLRLTGMEG